MENLRRSDGINTNTYNLLFSDYDNIPEEDYNDQKYYVACATIDYFTKLKDKTIFTKLLKLFYRDTILDLDNITFNYETKEYEYKSDSIIISFDKISNRLEDKNMIKELTSTKRIGKCHIMSMVMAPKIENSKIVTGYITFGNQKCLHSVIEYEYDDEIIILDWTMNLKISKEQYTKLTKFVEISSFLGANFIEDCKLIYNKLDINSKFYVVFRDELINDIQKNISIFSSNNCTESTVKQKEKNKHYKVKTK